MRGWARAALAGVLALTALGAARADEPLKAKIGVLRLSSSAPVFIAQDKGYFRDAGLDVELKYFDAAQPVAVAATSGDIDVGITAFTAGLYNLAGKGALKIIGGVNRDVPGFRAIGYYVSNRAYDAGVRTLRDFAGHSAGVTTVGSTYHYTLGLLEQHGGVAPKAVRVLALQSIPNIASALTGGQTDIAVLPVPYATPAEKRGNYKLLGYVSDVAPWQVGVIWTATKTANTKPDLVKRFYRAYRKGGRDYNDAFTGPDGKRIEGPTAPAVLAIIAKHIGQTVEQIAPGISYVDPDGRLDLADIANQIRWYKSQGMVKSGGEAKNLVDRRYAVDVAGK